MGVVSKKKVDRALADLDRPIASQTTLILTPVSLITSRRPLLMMTIAI